MVKIECSQCGELYEFQQSGIFSRNRNECDNCGKPFLTVNGEGPDT